MKAEKYVKCVALVCFSVAVINCSDKCIFRGKGLLLAHSSSAVHHGRESRQQVLEASSLIALIMRSRGE